MGKDKVEKEKKRAEKKEKRAEKDGVHKSKKDKKEKKDKTALADAVEKEITTQVLDGLDQAASAAVVKTTVDVAEPMDIESLVGALVPFAQPLVEDKTAKKVLKSVKKGTFYSLPPMGSIDFFCARYTDVAAILRCPTYVC